MDDDEHLFSLNDIDSNKALKENSNFIEKYKVYIIIGIIFICILIISLIIIFFSSSSEENNKDREYFSEINCTYNIKSINSETNIISENF